MRCPECGSDRQHKDGLRQLFNGETTQRYLCRNCGYRFSENSNKQYSTKDNRQICVLPGAKNLAKATETKTVAGEYQKDAKGSIIEVLWKLKREGYAQSTITTYSHLLHKLVEKGANLEDPENVKDVIAANEKWTISRKYNATKAYTTFLRIKGRKWEKPQYRLIPKLPFIPTEKEIDSLVAGSSRQVATFLQLLKETAARAGEAIRLEWTDLDTERNTIRISPEKGSNPRMFKMSNKIMAMLSNQPKSTNRIFRCKTAQSMGNSYRRQRRRIAIKLGNPRLNQIKLHTLRHWKATMEYHRTKDILHVKQMLGHKNIENTLLYTQLVNFEENNFSCKVAKTLSEATQLVEAGFDYVTDLDDYKLFRKRK